MHQQNFSTAWCIVLVSRHGAAYLTFNSVIWSHYQQVRCLCCIWNSLRRILCTTKCHTQLSFMVSSLVASTSLALLCPHIWPCVIGYGRFEFFSLTQHKTKTFWSTWMRREWLGGNTRYWFEIWEPSLGHSPDLSFCWSSWSRWLLGPFTSSSACAPSCVFMPVMNRCQYQPVSCSVVCAHSPHSADCTVVVAFMLCQAEKLKPYMTMPLCNISV